MGLIKKAVNAVTDSAKGLGSTIGGAAINSIDSVINQAVFKEYFSSGSMAGDIIMKRAEQVKSNGSRNNKGDANVITNGSVIDIQPNQCMIIVENGKIIDACMEPGQYVYDNTVAPSFFGGEGDLWDKFKTVGAEMYQQFQFGGQRHSTQRIYYINTGMLDTSIKWGIGAAQFKHTEIMNNGMPFKMNITLKGNGSIRIQMARPLDFFTQYGAKFIGGDNNGIITLNSLESFFSSIKGQLTDAIGSSITLIGVNHQIGYDEIIAFKDEIVKSVNSKMSDSYVSKVGFDFSEFQINDGLLKPSDADRDKIQKLQENSFVANDPNMANFSVQQTMAEGFKEAGKNGGISGVMGMGMAMGGAGANLGQMQYQQPTNRPMPQQVQSAVVSSAAAPGWKCSCGKDNSIDSMFCSGCGSKKPAPSNGWTCSCGKVNQEDSLFCPGCGSKKPSDTPDAGWTCECGNHVVDGMFCSKCGKKKPNVEIKKVIICDKCGWRSEILDTKFCPKCGDPVNEADIAVERPL